jgi:uncharacterized membrane protein YraQ (UPF0718 family)
MTVSGLKLPNLRQLRQFDRVWLAILILITALLVLLPQQGLASVKFASQSFASILPFLLVSLVLAGWVNATGLDKQLGRILQGRMTTVITSAAAFGALSPFCSCGVIPVIAALLAAGMPLPAIMAFWLASPLMSPEIFWLSSAELGFGFATARLITALGIGLAAGFATWALERRGLFTSPLQDSAKPCGCSAKRSLAEQPIVWRFWQDAARRATFWKTVRTTGLQLSKWLVLAFVLESLMLRYLPASLVGAWLGGANWWTLPLATVVGVPAYLNGYAAIPTIAGLIDLGMAPSAGLAFLTAGAATSVPAAMAVFPLVKRPVFIWYVGLALIGSLVAGLGYSFIA